MTVTDNKGAVVKASAALPAPADLVTFTIDGVEMAVPKGTLVIRAAEQVGIQIPRFCDHPLLEPAGACRQCLVDVAVPDRDGNVRPMPKPQASCTLEASPGMVVKTQHTSPVADKAQHGIMEMLLINHPLDCPVCDKGGECPLQNQAMSNGRATSRFIDVKRTFPKPISISTEILLDRERCILCQRCTRFSKQIAGDAFIDLQKRGAQQQIGRFDPVILGFADSSIDRWDDTADAGSVGSDTPSGFAEPDESGLPFASYFSGNTVQICPVGALTGAAYRFRSRPFDLVSTPSVSEHDSSGSAIRVDHRRGTVMRRLAGDDPAVNEEWITDKDRFAFTWQSAPDRLTTPMIRERGEGGFRGELRPASWMEALDAAAAGLRAAQAGDRRTAGGVGVLPGGRLTIEDSYAYAKFARVALGTNDVDYRSRDHSAEEEAFLASTVAGSGIGVTFADLERAAVVLLVGIEAEEEAGVVFLRLRKGALAHGLQAYSIAPFATRGLARIGAGGGTLLRAAPGTEAEVLDAIGSEEDLAHVRLALEGAGAGRAVIVVGERLAAVPGGYSAALRLAQRTGARLAWIPRRAGERGAVEMGALASLLPGGRPVADAAARVDLAAAWGTDPLPQAPGRDTAAILAALSAGDLRAVVVGGVELADLPDPDAARVALEMADFVVSLEVRSSDVTAHADVVFPVAPPAEKAGAFWNWEGRVRPFGQALESVAMADHRVLDAIADVMGTQLGLGTLDGVRSEIEQLGTWDGARVGAPDVSAHEPPSPVPGQAVLAGWRMLLDCGRAQDGEVFLAGTAKRPVARMSAGTARTLSLATDGDLVSVTTTQGAITLPLVITDMPDHVVWLPLNSPGSQVHRTLGVGPGAIVEVSRPDAAAGHTTSANADGKDA
ncbi:NADH dehydrogenase subunit G [Sanguibacter gelidistatuariae]|uniref:NADH dehydrogenase subunit G n=1 Tax=Sanguibacter gelidistatuariae TaxID=1814289 RepID=A0A1G6X073_9MICO|nr:NADH-quinone oxidoreductase subunit G [Sanguibacter gelidistatuariae]SDD71293.1 NADH dehydrogenase subunit G [Sanguibacter gelidistatuariae]